MDAKQFQSMKKHSELLAQFIMRLSRYYEGISPEIDKELNVLRSHLAGTTNFTLAESSLRKLEQVLMSSDDTVKVVTKQTIKQLEGAVKKLQRNATEQVNDSATKLLVTLNQPINSLYTAIEYYDKVLKLHLDALETEPKTKKTIAIENHHAVTENDQTRQQITDELYQLIGTYAQTYPDDPMLAELRDKIVAGLDESELLRSCLVLIRLIVRESMNEAVSAGKVVQHLHNAMSKMQTEVDAGISTSQQVFRAKEQSNQTLRSQLTDINEVVTETDSLTELKQQAQHHLDKMANTLSEREATDQAEQEAIMSLLTSMQSELTTLQHQAMQYRRKIAAQRQSVYTDSLTRLPNRQAYNERLQREAERCQNSGGTLAIGLIDVDHFKNINDKYGHAVGDKTLQIIARHLKKHIGKDDFIARWGGEEFVVLLPDANADLLTDTLETIRKTLADMPFKFKQEKVSITVSAGATLWQPTESIEDAFERADQNLYAAKHAGRNLVKVQ